MDRRVFIGSLALGTLRSAPAQPAPKVYRIGILGAGPTTSDMVGPQPRAPSTIAFLRGLRELGYVYGGHFVTEPRGAEGKPERYPSLAAELVSLRPAAPATVARLSRAAGAAIPMARRDCPDGRH